MNLRSSLQRQFLMRSMYHNAPVPSSVRTSALAVACNASENNVVHCALACALNVRNQQSVQCAH
jgi:hypothetical protein